MIVREFTTLLLVFSNIYTEIWGYDCWDQWDRDVINKTNSIPRCPGWFECEACLMIKGCSYLLTEEGESKCSSRYEPLHDIYESELVFAKECLAGVGRKPYRKCPDELTGDGEDDDMLVRCKTYNTCNNNMRAPPLQQDNKTLNEQTPVLGEEKVHKAKPPLWLNSIVIGMSNSSTKSSTTSRGGLSDGGIEESSPTDQQLETYKSSSRRNHHAELPQTVSTSTTMKSSLEDGVSFSLDKPTAETPTLSQTPTSIPSLPPTLGTENEHNETSRKTVNSHMVTQVPDLALFACCGLMIIIGLTVVIIISLRRCGQQSSGIVERNIPLDTFWIQNPNYRDETGRVSPIEMLTGDLEMDFVELNLNDERV